MKAVIPAAGLGTRMLPATKSQPKEMLPIVDRPAIQWVVEEAIAAGCEEIVVVSGPTKRAMEEHFGPSDALLRRLEGAGNVDAAAKVRAVVEMGRRVRFVEQAHPLGLGHAVLTARAAVGRGPFAVLLGDDILVGRARAGARAGDGPGPGGAEAGANATRMLADAHARLGGSVLCVQEVAPDDVRRYGVIDPGPVGAPASGPVPVRAMVEKPDPARAPSRLAAVGRYVLTPAVFDELEAGKPDARGELQLTDAIGALARSGREPVHALRFHGRRYDVGTLPGWLEANVALAGP
ncbi:MAG TPA: UTP--glucose-1-phosphate uridylyltransferase [Candidatus Thermoplasmatota archaeon]|nr:UTP--glucose-1-phosphate uridylyltransferase [Candidatus Thermoplasmatota archaeon]